MPMSMSTGLRVRVPRPQPKPKLRYVRHAARASWGLGLVVDDSPYLVVWFLEAGVKKFAPSAPLLAAEAPTADELEAFEALARQQTEELQRKHDRPYLDVYDSGKLLPGGYGTGARR